MAMEPNPSPSIASFVIRFVLDEVSPEKETLGYRGAIRHIQSDEEMNFHTWEDAVKFIQSYVPLERQSNQEGT
jgi:hypothetical protein